MRIRQLTRSTALLLLILNASRAIADEPQDKVGAQVDYQRGLALANQGKLEEAIAAFEAAYRLSPRYAVLYNIGRAQSLLGNSVAALDAFERYLAEGGAHISPARHEEVSDLIAIFKRRVGSLRLEVGPVGADVFLNGRALGKAPLATPLRVAVGTHAVSATCAGCSAFVENVVVSAAETTTVRGDAKPEPPPPACPVRPPPALRVTPRPQRAVPATTPSRRTVALVSGAASAVAFGTAAGLYAWNARRHETWQSDLDAYQGRYGVGNAASWDEGGRLRERAVSLQRVDDLALGVAISGAISLAIGTVLWLSAEPAAADEPRN